MCRDYPEVARHLAWLKTVGGAQMTGSGACVFAAFPDESAARRALASCPPEHARLRGAGAGRDIRCTDWWIWWTVDAGGGIGRLQGKRSVGESPSSVKAPDFDSGMRRFESYLPSHLVAADRAALIRGV